MPLRLVLELLLILAQRVDDDGRGGRPHPFRIARDDNVPHRKIEAKKTYTRRLFLDTHGVHDRGVRSDIELLRQAQHLVQIVSDPTCLLAAIVLLSSPR